MLSGTFKSNVHIAIFLQRLSDSYRVLKLQQHVLTCEYPPRRHTWRDIYHCAQVAKTGFQKVLLHRPFCQLIVHWCCSHTLELFNGIVVLAQYGSQMRRLEGAFADHTINVKEKLRYSPMSLIVNDHIAYAGESSARYSCAALSQLSKAAGKSTKSFSYISATSLWCLAAILKFATSLSILIASNKAPTAADVEYVNTNKNEHPCVTGTDLQALISYSTLKHFRNREMPQSENPQPSYEALLPS